MQLIEKTDDLRHELAALRSKERIALIATMGCLHDGHISLIRKAKRLADVVVVSIYVNPLQFSAEEDLDRYLRPFAEDTRRCEAEGVDLLFHPESLFATPEPMVTLHVQTLGECLCGRFRPGHFDGMLTVVNALFNIVEPDLAIFGEKDWQQLSIVRRMVYDLNMPVAIASAPIMREENGLAMSSRNQYLTVAERKRATCLFQALTVMRKACLAGETNCVPLLAMATTVLRNEGLDAEYLEIRNSNTLKPISTIEADAHAFIAVRINNTRLIDNMALTKTLQKGE
ncbi:MAG: pantoate--beta-alanine ligase [Mariprofundaceae bacterium]|nr:pantoate--beta-alanine ligase [Mariprofundaceae bacterium]